MSSQPYPAHCLALALLAIPPASPARQSQDDPGKQPRTTAENPAQQGAGASAIQDKNPLIAKVGTVEMRLGDLFKEFNRLIPLNFYHRKVPPERLLEFRKKAFDSLVLDRRIYLDALDRKLPVTEQEMRDKLTKALKAAGPKFQELSKERFEREFENNRELIRRLLLVEKNKARFETTIPGVGEAQLRRVYDLRLEQDKNAFQADREAHLLQIFVQFDPARVEKDVAEKRAKMQEAKKELGKGTPFSDVARLYSEGDKAKQGGDLGWVKENARGAKAIKEVAFGLKPGEVSEVFESLYGLHIIKCIEVKPSKTLSFDQMKPSLKLWLEKEHRSRTEQQWHAELESRYPVEILVPDLFAPLEPAGNRREAGTGAGKGHAPSSRPAGSDPSTTNPAPPKPDSRPTKGNP